MKPHGKDLKEQKGNGLLVVDLKKSIQDRAYFIWEAKGRPPGAALVCWLQAKREFEEHIEPGGVSGDGI